MRVIAWSPYHLAMLLTPNRPVLWTWGRLHEMTAAEWQRGRECLTT